MNHRFDLDRLDPVPTLMPSEAKPQEQAPQVNFLGDVQRMALQPGDVLVLTVDSPLSSEMADRLRATLESQLPGLQKVIVLERGMKLGLVLPLANVVTSHAHVFVKPADHGAASRDVQVGDTFSYVFPGHHV